MTKEEIQKRAQEYTLRKFGYSAWLPEMSLCKEDFIAGYIEGQADKAELVDMLKQLEKELFLLPITQERIHFCLSKHEAK